MVVLVFFLHHRFASVRVKLYSLQWKGVELICRTYAEFSKVILNISRFFLFSLSISVSPSSKQLMSIWNWMHLKCTTRAVVNAAILNYSLENGRVASRWVVPNTKHRTSNICVNGGMKLDAVTIMLLFHFMISTFDTSLVFVSFHSNGFTVHSFISLSIEIEI